MARTIFTVSASAALGLALTGLAAAQGSPESPEPDTTTTTTTDGTDTTTTTTTEDTDTTVSGTAEGTVSTPSAKVDLDVHTPPPPQPQPQPQPTYVIAPTPAPAPTTVIVDDDDDDVYSAIGIAIAAGGGAGGFTNEAMRDTTDVGGDWDVRLTVGTRSPLAFEGSYIGSSQDINALGLDDDALLVGNGVQGALRLNATLNLPVQPFAFAGAAWRRYDLMNTSQNTSDVEGSDNVMEFPMGVGIASRFSGMVLDIRGEFRASTMEDLMPEIRGEDNIELDADNSAAMHRWGAKATIGFEF